VKILTKTIKKKDKVKYKEYNYIVDEIRSDGTVDIISYNHNQGNWAGVNIKKLVPILYE
jgi:hypothetical protein